MEKHEERTNIQSRDNAQKSKKGKGACPNRDPQAQVLNPSPVAWGESDKERGICFLITFLNLGFGCVYLPRVSSNRIAWSTNETPAKLARHWQ